MTMSLVDFAVHDAVAVVRLNRPPVNALSDELIADLDSAFGKCEEDTVRAVVVTGHPHFAAGADIKGFREAHEADEGEWIAGGLVDVIWRLERLPKPTIAAVHGYALGGGLELAMGADFRYLADDAQVGQPEIRLGLIPGAGGTQRLPRIVGYQRAKELVFSGRHVDADEARDIGLADKIVPSADLLDEAIADAKEWSDKATKAIGAAKKAINDGWSRPLEHALEVESQVFNDLFWTEDAREGVAAFVEKRDPEFENR